VPTFVPETRVSDPDNVSDPTSDPVVTDHVKAGSLSPYCLVLVPAVTVIGRCVIDRFAETKVMSYFELSRFPIVIA